jgi:hypothetical protein
MRSFDGSGARGTSDLDDAATTNFEAAKIETIECGTNQDGSAVILILSSEGVRRRYTLPTTALAMFIEQLLKMHNTARAHGLLSDKSKESTERKVQPVLETFLVDDLSVVASDTGPVTVRIVSRDGSRDIVFAPAQWEYLRSPAAGVDPVSQDKRVH